MWRGGQGNSSPERYSHASNGGSNGDSPSEGQVAAAAALAARMAFANAYDAAAPAAPPAPSSFYDVYGATTAGQASTLGDQEDAAILYAQRARELELFHLQQQIQERQAIENEARNRLLEHAARNQIQEYERTRMQLELMAEMQQRDEVARIEAERNRAEAEAHHANANAILSQHEIDAAAAQNLQEQQLAEYIATQQKRAHEYDPNPSPQPPHADEEERYAAPELKVAASPIEKPESPPVENVVVEPPPKKDPPKKSPSLQKQAPPKKEPAPMKGQAAKKDPEKEHAAKKPAAKKEQSPKKEKSPKKEVSPKKGSPKKEKSSPKKKTPQTEQVTSKSPLETPSSSQLVDKKITPVETKSSAATKKRKKPPAKTSAAASGNKAKKAKKSPGAAAGKKATPQSFTSLIKRKPGVPSMDDSVPAITEVQFENAQALMTEFCKVPFLAEFSRPVSLLHPELVTLYSKIIHHPMDLGHVCRAIRRREYKNTRAIQLDVWRVFSNCIKFHMHPSNRENAIPSFISIATHLRDFFNSLWREYMMPSDAPPRAPGKGISHIHSTFQKRAEARKERLSQISATVLTPKCLQKLGGALENFISTGGKVDKLDSNAILGDPNSPKGDIATFIESLREVIKTMEAKIHDSEDYTVMELHRDMKKCYTEDVFEHEILKKMKISQRLDRILGKILAPIIEVSCRGVNQSSIWGCMAAAIWARESKKKPYWPGVVLGILAPEDQKEDWHQALTERNEARLPEKLRADLRVAKRRAEQGLKKQSSDLMSYFLVEFMGSHEFIWVKESDIIESFDPEEDVNIASAAGNITKKRRSTAFNSKQMSDAIEEGRWALEEFELQLNNTCGDRSDDEDDFNDDSGYTYDTLCRSDDEADEMDEGDEKAHESDIEELNELLSTDGLLDFSIEGRKKAKARAVAMKKQNALLVKKEKEREKAKKAKPPPKATPSKDNTKKIGKLQEMEEKREKRELELRRKKRAREHEKSLKELERKAKKKKSNTLEKKAKPSDVQNKRGRAEAIAKGFLMRKCIKDAAFNGAAFQPSSSVEPSGLLGMALAFRAAAGEIPFLDNTGKAFLENSWEAIDVESPLDSSERCKRLQEQIDMIGTEVMKVDAATERRLALTGDADNARVAAQNRILDADDQVRAAYAKKKKKPVKKAENSIIKPDVKANGGADKELSKDDSADVPNDKLAIQNELKELTNADQVDQQLSDA